ncbi:integrase catalytic domain-containing protein [Trichonephila clavipes]|nr:integrase catalytic domain-containing protein [Trichonephila clavipes]
MGKKSENKNNSNVVTEEKLNRLKDSTKGNLTRLEAFTLEKTVSKNTSVTEIEIKLKKIEQLQINLDKIAEDYCEIEIFESLEIIQLDIEDINQRIETTEEGNVILQNTKFGYLVTGTLPQSQQQANCCLISEPSLDITVKKFFELESLPDDSKEITKSEEEIYCEEHFVSTYKRDKTGRFIVRLPIKENAETLLGYSKENAIKRLNESTLEGAKKLQTRLSQLLQRGGFELHKWVSNSPELLKDLSASSYVFDKEFQDAPVKTLGMLWDPKVDCLTYKVKISDKVNFSKRDMLLEIARLYDPLGLIGPIVTKAKIFIQELWKIKLDWSEQLPPDAMEEWMNFKIPRCILLPATIRIEIHSFSDASKRADAAVVYIKCFNESGQSQTRLLCSKSRVSPLKTLTIPRLELSAALLLSRLVKKVVPILQLPIHKIWMWTDSTIALAWIKTESHKLKTFVSNRVAEI